MPRKVMSIVLWAFMFTAVFGIEVVTDVDAQITEEWERIYNGPGNYNDFAYSMAVDQFGNVYVTGQSWGGDPSLGGTSNDYATVAYDSNGDSVFK